MTDSDPAPFTKQHWAKTRNNKEGKADMQPDWTKPAAKAIPKEGFFEEEQGRYGPIFPRAPACYGFTIIAKIKPGTEQTIRSYGKKIEETIAGLPDALILRVARHNCENGRATDDPAFSVKQGSRGATGVAPGLTRRRAGFLTGRGAAVTGRGGYQSDADGTAPGGIASPYRDVP